MLALSLFLLALVSTIAPILAQRRSTCQTCRNPILPDDPIVESSVKGWVHEECAEETEIRNVTRPHEGEDDA